MCFTKTLRTSIAPVTYAHIYIGKNAGESIGDDGDK